MCSENGDWSDTDFSKCTMRSDSNPLLVFEVNITSTVDDAAGIMSDVSWSNEILVYQLLSSC